MPAGKYNLVIEQGATFKRTLVYRDSTGQPIDLTDYTPTAQIRLTPDSAAKIDLTCTVVSAVDGELTIALAAVDTAALTLTRGVWDLKLTSSTETIRLLEGIVTVTKEVTK